MKDPELPLYRSRRKRHDWRAWIIALAAAALFGSMCGLSFVAESAAMPPRPRTERALPGRHEQRLYCRNFLQPGEAAKRAECRRLGGYR